MVVFLANKDALGKLTRYAQAQLEKGTFRLLALSASGVCDRV